MVHTKEKQEKRDKHHKNRLMKNRNDPKLVISISLEVEHHQLLRKMATKRGLFILNGSKKGEPNISGLIKKITEEHKMETYIQQSSVCEYAKEIFTEMVRISENKNLQFFDQAHVEQMLQEAVESCHLRHEFLEDEELYRGDISHLINNRPG